MNWLRPLSQVMHRKLFAKWLKVKRLQRQCVDSVATESESDKLENIMCSNCMQLQQQLR